MIFHQHIETNRGEIWVLDASKNGYVKHEGETRQEFEARVLKEIIHATIGECELDHHPNGAPFIKNQQELYISISHSENWFALHVSKEEPVGIDIELNSQQVEKTKSYFLTESETERLQPNQQELQVCWGIKESVYKCLQGNVGSLKDEVEIVSMRGNEARATFKNQSIQLRFEQLQAYTLVYSVNPSEIL